MTRRSCFLYNPSFPITNKGKASKQCSCFIHKDRMECLT
uniref:Uncharacterized protein n=1 Tax=Arundo donax TaxID=35708 RepID=A0A0A9SUB3_ARUDO